MDYVCPECGFTAEEAGSCPDCEVMLVEESEAGSEESDYGDDDDLEDDEEW